VSASIQCARDWPVPERRVGRDDLEQVRRHVVAERDALALGGRERDVRAVARAVGAVVLRPAEPCATFSSYEPVGSFVVENS
jgi:hypothetical protein